MLAPDKIVETLTHIHTVAKAKYPLNGVVAKMAAQWCFFYSLVMDFKKSGMLPPLLQRSSNDQPLYFVCAFIYLGYLGIPHTYFHRIIPAITIAAQDLNCFGSYVHGYIAGEGLAHR